MVETINDWDRRLELTLASVRKKVKRRANQDVITRFMDECFAQGLSKGRATKYAYYLTVLDGWHDASFRDAGVDDIKRLVGAIERSSYADSTKKELKICIKKVYKWMRGTAEYPPEVRWITPHKKGLSRLKMPEELLTEEDVENMILAARSPRDRALVASLYETGCRIGELLFLRVRHIAFEDFGARLRVEGKTGARRIPIVSCVPYVTAWLNAMPKHDAEGYVWCGPRGKPLGYTQVRQLLTKLARRAGITKRVHPHLFRHSRATYLANYLTEAQMKEYFGWVQGSDMASVYVHLSGRDVDKAILSRVYGVQTPEDPTTSRLTPRSCGRCKTNNQSTHEFCRTCGFPLKREAQRRFVQQAMERKSADETMDQLLEDDEVRDLLARKLRDMGRSEAA